MKHIPTLFSTDMVQAIIEDRKKKTRRTKGIPDFKADDYKCFDMGGGWYFFERNKYSFDRMEVKAPYSIGDILWLRESHTIEMMRYRYKADDYITDEEKAENIKLKWRPSIHMPKEACRIFLKVTDVRVERLHEITEQDAVDEGIEFNVYPRSDERQFKNYMGNASWFKNPIHSFQSLWAKINGQSSWDANPYIWVISFERCDRPSDFLNQITK